MTTNPMSPTEAWLKEAHRAARENFEKENPHLANDEYYKEHPEKSMTFRAHLAGQQCERERSAVVVESKELPPEATGKHMEAMLSFFTGDSQRSAPDEQEWEKLLHKLALEEKEAHLFRRFPMSADYKTEAIFSRGFDAALSLIAKPLLAENTYLKGQLEIADNNGEDAERNWEESVDDFHELQEVEKSLRAQLDDAVKALEWITEDRGTPTFESQEQAVHYYSQFLFSYERKAKAALAKLKSGSGEKV